MKFDSLLLKEAVVEGDGILPPLRGEEDSSSSESDDGEVDDSGYAKGKSLWIPAFNAIVHHTIIPDHFASVSP